MHEFFAKVANLPYIGSVVAYTILIPIYVFYVIFMPIIFRLGGLHRLKFGTLTMWMPQNKKTIITEALELLHSQDQEIFLTLTKEHHLLIFFAWNTKETAKNSFGYAFGMNEVYFKWGTQGVVLFLVQSLAISKSCPTFYQYKNKPERHLRRNVLEWPVAHSFQPKLIDAYRKVVEKWEQNNEAHATILELHNEGDKGHSKN